MSGDTAEKRPRGRPKGSTKANGAGKAKDKARARKAAAADPEIQNLPVGWVAKVERAGERLKAAPPTMPADYDPEAEEVEVLDGEIYGAAESVGGFTEDEEEGYFKEGPGVRGRKHILVVNVVTFQAIWRAGLIDCTDEETAARLGVSQSTWDRFKSKYPIARECFEDARLVGNSMLRETMFKDALEGGFQLGHLARHRLGQTDKAGILDAKAVVRETLHEAGAALRERALDLIRRRQQGDTSGGDE